VDDLAEDPEHRLASHGEQALPHEFEQPHRVVAKAAAVGDGVGLREPVQGGCDQGFGPAPPAPVQHRLAGARPLGDALHGDRLGPAFAGILFWLGSVEGGYWAVAGAIALALLAAAWTVLGLTKLLGRAGTVLGAVTIMLVGNPLSGLTSAPELLPAPLGAVGQHLTPGAGATLLRSVSFFEGHGAQAAAVVLAAWLAGGIVLFTVGAVRARAAALADRPSRPAGAPA